MLLLQLPAILAVILILTRGRYSTHPVTFWCVVIFGLLACWLYSVQRSGRHRTGGDTPFVFMFELLTGSLVVASWIFSILGIVVSFL